MSAWSVFLKRRKLSESAAAKLAGISRLTWRAVTGGKDSVELKSVCAAAAALEREVHVLITPPGDAQGISALAAAYGVLTDGRDSWKIHYMNFVDDFRRTLDPRLLVLPPPAALPKELLALLASITWSLCIEAGMDAPAWAKKRYDLDRPWFVSGMESLKAMSILESPLPFRRNGIFVGENFLKRA